MIQFLATALPSVILVYIFYTFDVFPEPKRLVIYTFIFGIFITFPAAHINTYAIDYFSNSYEQDPKAIYIFWYNLIPGATVEEILKFLVLFFFCRRLKDFNEPMDGLVYGSAVALGFAMKENFQYVYNAHIFYSEWEAIAVLRAFLTVPMHAFCGIMIGFSISYYTFVKRNILIIPIGLIVAITFHALFNVNAGNDLAGFLVSFQLIIVIALFRMLRKKQIDKLTIFNKDNFKK